MKGLFTSPEWSNATHPIRSALDFYYVGLNKVMFGPNWFNWSVMRNQLDNSRACKNHVIWRVYVHFPNHPLALPQFLIGADVPLLNLTVLGEVSPDYNHPAFLNATKSFIEAFAKRFDASLGYAESGVSGTRFQTRTITDY